MVGWIVLGAFVLLAIIIVAWIISVYNGLIRMRNNVDEGFSTMDVYLQKRYDLIPNLVETVKGYAKHEKETLEKVIKARNQAVNAGTPEEQLKGENMLSGALRQLAVVIEKYPDLKADAQFIDLQNTLKTLEAEIANSRKYYNGVTKAYNVKREVFPSNIIANWFKFDKKPLYEIDEEEHRKNVKVKFADEEKEEVVEEKPVAKKVVKTTAAKTTTAKKTTAKTTAAKKTAAKKTTKK